MADISQITQNSKRMIYGLIKTLIIGIMLIALPVRSNSQLISGQPGVDTSEFNNLSTAILSPLTAGKTIVISKPVICDSLTIPGNRTIKIIGGGSINNSGPLIINGPFEAGLFQVFTGGGRVSFGDASHPAMVKEVFPQWWGAKGDWNGTSGSDDRVAILKAMRAYRVVNFGTKKGYYLGAFDNSIAILPVAYDDTILRGNGAELVVTTVARTIPYVLYVDGYNNFHCDGLKFRDTGYDSTVNWKGAVAIAINATNGPSRGHRTTNIECNNMLAAIQIQPFKSELNRIDDIRVDNLIINNSYYGINCRENGDNLTVTRMTTRGMIRSYFVYGVSNHNVEITSYDHWKFNDVLIKRYLRNTNNINLRFTTYNDIGKDAVVSIEHQPPMAGTSVISNISIDIFRDGVSTEVPVLKFTSLTKEGRIENTTSNLWDNIFVDGNFPINSQAIIVKSDQSRKGRMVFGKKLLSALPSTSDKSETLNQLSEVLKSFNLQLYLPIY